MGRALRDYNEYERKVMKLEMNNLKHTSKLKDYSLSDSTLKGHYWFTPEYQHQRGLKIKTAITHFKKMRLGMWIRKRVLI